MEEIDPSSWVHLNVGGKIFDTTIGTLTEREPESKLVAMFSRRTLKTDHKGCVLIDRNGDYFDYILNWLRDGDIPCLDDVAHYHVLNEAEYYQLLGLIDRINPMKTSVVDLTRSDVIQCTQSKHTMFQGVNLSGIDMSNLALAHVSFRGANLKGANFDGATLSQADLTSANLTGSTFNNVDARGTIFSDSASGDCIFTWAKLVGANFTRAHLDRANFDCPKLVGANFIGASLTSSSFKNANAQGVIFGVPYLVIQF